MQISEVPQSFKGKGPEDPWIFFFLFLSLCPTNVIHVATHLCDWFWWYMCVSKIHFTFPITSFSPLFLHFVNIILYTDDFFMNFY